MLLAAADDNGCRFGHHCCRRVSPISIKHRGKYKKITSTLIYWIYQIALMASLEKSCARPPTPQAAWVHQIHAAWGVGDSTTMVMVFVVCFGLICLSSLVVCRQVREKNLKMGLWVWQPPRLAPYQMWQYDAGRIDQWRTSKASLKATGCRRWSSACAILPRWPPWSLLLNETYKTLLKHSYWLATMVQINH